MTESMHKFRKVISEVFLDKPVVNKYTLTEEDLKDNIQVPPRKFKIRNQTATPSMAIPMEAV